MFIGLSPSQFVSYFLYNNTNARSSRPEVFLEISKNSQKNTCARVSFLIKLQACNFIKKETLAQVLSCEFWEISKNSFFTEHFWWLLLKRRCVAVIT